MITVECSSKLVNIKNSLKPRIYHCKILPKFSVRTERHKRVNGMGLTKAGFFNTNDSDNLLKSAYLAIYFVIVKYHLKVTA